MADEQTPEPIKRETPSKPNLKQLAEAKLRPLIEKASAFFSARNTREKAMLVIFAAAFLLFLDYWILIRPVIGVFTETVPRLSSLDVELDGLRQDKKNRAHIAIEWEESKALVIAKEDTFITRDRVPALLENISKLALDSGVKILSLKPLAPTVEKPVRGAKKAAKGAAPAKGTSRNSLVLIRLNGLAGTHEFGSFLARLESGPTFFRVKDIHIVSQGELDIRHHSLEVNIETYSRHESTLVKK